MMLYCMVCGTENLEDSNYCIKCGKSLKSGEYATNKDICLGGNKLSNFFQFLILIFGLILISSGVNQLLDFYRIRFTLWPFVLILIGILIVYWGISRYRR